jgi:hypothetical protein
MRRIRFVGLVVAATLGIGVASASAHQVVTFWEFVPQVAGGHGLQPIGVGDVLDFDISQLEITTSRGSTACTAAPLFFGATLLSNRQPTDELRLDQASIPGLCGSGAATAQVSAQRLPWWLAVSANHTASLMGATITLAFAGGPTCLYRAPTTNGQFAGAFGPLSIDALLQLVPTRQAGCSPWATLTIVLGEVIVSSPEAFAAIENAPPGLQWTYAAQM